MDISLTTLSIAHMVQGVAAAIPAGADQVVNAGAHYTAQAQRDLGLVHKPLDTAAKAATRSTTLQRFAAGIGRVVPWVAVGAGAASGAQAVANGGPKALINTKQGRGAVLGVVGGSLLLVPTPATQLSAAGVLAVSAANEFGAFNRLDVAP